MFRSRLVQVRPNGFGLENPNAFQDERTRSSAIRHACFQSNKSLVKQALFSSYFCFYNPCDIDNNRYYFNSARQTTLRRSETRRPPETHDESSVKSAKNRPDYQDITLATLIILINTMIIRLDKPQNVVGFLQKNYILSSTNNV